MKRLVAVLMVIGLLVTISSQASAVDFQEQIKKLAQKNAEGYIGPFATAFGTAMNSGYYHTAKPHKLLGFDIGVKMAMVTVPEDAQSFDFFVGSIALPAAAGLGVSGDLNINLEYLYPNRETPTVFGDDKLATLEPDPNGADDALVDALKQADKSDADIALLQGTPAWTEMINTINANVQPIPTVQGTGIDFLPLAVPQVSLGLPFKTEILVRYLPEMEAGDVDKVSFMGGGVKHNLSQYIPVPMFPVDISGQYAWEQLKVGDIITSTHWAANVHASKKFGFGLSITPYVGVGIEGSNIEVDYTVDPTFESYPGGPVPGDHFEFDMKGKNKMRLTGGVRIGLPLISINADYSMGEYSAITAGLAITLR